MTPLTMCPGTQAYMPPEALITPPRYSNKLDCFSHGVLTIQIVTRQFPNPGDAQVTIRDTRFPTGKYHVPVPERERRKKDIDLVDPNHPLLPLALHCLMDDDTERPSADELCERLATLKGEQKYTHSVEQSRKQSVSVQTLQQQIQAQDGQLQDQLQQMREELNSKESEMEQVIAEFHAQVQACESANEQLRKENLELHRKQEQLKARPQLAEAPRATPRRKQEPAKGATGQVSSIVKLTRTIYVNFVHFMLTIRAGRWMQG